MKNTIPLHDELTYCGLMLLQNLGNRHPSLHQIEFAQEMIALIDGNDPIKNKQLMALFTKYETQSRESLQRDAKYFRETHRQP